MASGYWRGRHDALDPVSPNEPDLEAADAHRQSQGVQNVEAQCDRWELLQAEMATNPQPLAPAAAEEYDRAATRPYSGFCCPWSTAPTTSGGSHLPCDLRRRRGVAAIFTAADQGSNISLNPCRLASCAAAATAVLPRSSPFLLPSPRCFGGLGKPCLIRVIPKNFLANDLGRPSKKVTSVPRNGGGNDIIRIAKNSTRATPHLIEGG
jgi:hypothetical protein